MHLVRRQGIPRRKQQWSGLPLAKTWVCLLVLAAVTVNCEVPDEVVTAQRGESVMLTCPIDVTSCGELHSVKWFKGNDRVAVVSGDGTVENVEGPFTGRMTIAHNPKGPASTLHIKSVQVPDENTFVCETTFLEPKENCENSGSFTIGLQVHVPPLSIRMLDETATPITNATTVGPLREGHRWTSTCEVRGTRPNPQVGWYRAGKRLTDSVATDESDGLFTVKSVISMVLTRHELGANIECRVETPAVPNIISNQFHLDLNVRPTKVQLSGLKPHIPRGIIVQAICLVTGARPAANITWFNNTEAMDAARKSDKRNISTKTELRNDGTFTTLSKLVFTASRFENGATIRCEADNGVHKNDSAPAAMLDSFTMAVLYPPVVTIKPANVTVNETGEFQLSCDYEANPSALKDVKWFRDGKLVDLNQGRVHKLNKDGTSIRVGEANRNDIGAYRCELENAHGKGIADNEIDIDVYFVPIVELTMEPNNTIIENNESNVTLFCNVLKGNPSQLLKVRWFLDGQILKELPECADNELEEDEPLCGVNPNVLLLENVGREFLGNYSCEGMNAAGWGRRSKENELVVYYEPGNATLAHHPLVATKKKGVTFTCAVDDLGYPKATRYRWLRGGSPVMDVVTPVWTVDAVGLDSRTNFSCYAYNEGGKGNLATVQLDVKAPQAFIQKLHPYTGALFSTPAIALSCRVECVPACAIDWFKDGVGIEAGNDHYHIKNTYLPAEPAVGDFESVLSVLNFNMSAWPDRKFDILRDNANYSCASSSPTDGPGVRSATYFGVEYPPENTAISSSVVDVELGAHPPRVSCSAKAYPEPSYEWRRKGLVISKGNVLYIFRNMSADDDGVYECVAFNKHGNMSAHMHMNVLYKPNCTLTRKEINSEDTLVCTAMGNPAEINFDWTMRSDNETVGLPEVRKSQSGNVSTSFLTLGEDFAVQRTYRCMTNNSLGAGQMCEIDVAVWPKRHILWWQRLDKLTLYVLLGLIIALMLAVIIVCIIIICICRKRRRQNKYHTDLSISATQSDLLFPKPRQQIAAAPQRPPPPALDAVGLPPPPSATAEIPKSPPKWPLRPGVMVHVKVDTKQNLCAARAQSPLAQRHNATVAGIEPLDATNSNGVGAVAQLPPKSPAAARTSSATGDSVAAIPLQSPNTSARTTTTTAIYATPHNVSYASPALRRTASTTAGSRDDTTTRPQHDNNEIEAVVVGPVTSGSTMTMKTTASSEKRTPPPPPPRNFRDKSTGSRVNISTNKLQQLLQNVNFAPNDTSGGGTDGGDRATGVGGGGGEDACIHNGSVDDDGTAVIQATEPSGNIVNGELITLTRTRLIERILERWPRRRPKPPKATAAAAAAVDPQEMSGDEELGCRRHQQQQQPQDKGSTKKKRSMNLLRRSVRLFGSGKSTNSGTALFDKRHHIAGLSSSSDGVVTYKRTPVAPVRPVVVVAAAAAAVTDPTAIPTASGALSAAAVTTATAAMSTATTTTTTSAMFEDALAPHNSTSPYNDKSSVAGDPLTEPGEYEILPFHGMGSANSKFRSNCASTTKRDVVRVAPQPKHPTTTYSYNLASSFPASYSTNNFHPSPNNSATSQLHHTPANYPNFQITSMNYTNYPTNIPAEPPTSNDCAFVSAAATPATTTTVGPAHAAAKAPKPNGGTGFRNGFLSASASAFNPFLSKAARASKKSSKSEQQQQLQHQQQQRFNSLKSMGAKNAPEFHSMRTNKCKRHHSTASGSAATAASGAAGAPDAHPKSSSAMPYISQQFQSLDAQLFHQQQQPLYENLTDSIQIHEASLCTNDGRSHAFHAEDGGAPPHEYRADDGDDDQLQRNSLYRSDSGISNSSYECVTPVPAPRMNPRKCQSAPVYMNLPGKGHRRAGGGGGSGRSSKGKGGGHKHQQHHKCRNDERAGGGGGGGGGPLYTYERTQTNPFIAPCLRQQSQSTSDSGHHRKPLDTTGGHSLSQHAVNGMTSLLVPSSSSSSTASAGSNNLSSSALPASRRPVKLPLRKHHTFHFQSSQTVAGARGQSSASKPNHNRKHYRNNGPLVFKPFSEETAFKPITPVPKSPSQHAASMVQQDGVGCWSPMDQQHYLGHNSCSTVPRNASSSLKRHTSNVETFHARVVNDEDDDSSPPSSSSTNRVGRKLHYADLAPLGQPSMSNSSNGSTGSGSGRGGTSTAVVGTSSSSNEENNAAAMQMKMYGRPRPANICGVGAVDSPKRATQYATLKYNEINM